MAEPCGALAGYFDQEFALRRERAGRVEGPTLQGRGMGQEPGLQYTQAELSDRRRVAAEAGRRPEGLAAVDPEEAPILHREVHRRYFTDKFCSDEPCGLTQDIRDRRDQPDQGVLELS